MLGSDPPPPQHGRKGSPSANPPPGTATKEGEGGVGQMGFRAIPPPQSNFLPAQSTGMHTTGHELHKEKNVDMPHCTESALDDAPGQTSHAVSFPGQTPTLTTRQIR